MDKINIVSSQAVLNVSSFCMDTRSKSSSPLVNSLDRTRHRWAAVSIHPHYGFVCSRHDAAYYQNFLLCNNNEIIACIADLLNSLCEEVYVVAVFEVMQQQTTGEVVNSITFIFCGQIIIYLCNSERIIKIWQYLRKLCSNEKGPVFLTHSVQYFRKWFASYFFIYSRAFNNNVI